MARSGANWKEWPKKLNVQIEFLEFRSDIPDILCIFDVKCIKKLGRSYFSVLAKTNENTSDQ